MAVLEVMGRKARLLESGCILAIKIAGTDSPPFLAFLQHPYLHARNVSEPLKGEVQTNQRAELTAIQRALEIVPRDRDIYIYTDSNYSIKCCTVWYVNWQKNNWMTTQHEPVMNKDLVLAIRALIDERNAKGAKTNLEWVKGHDKNLGNEAADKLAVAGSMTRRS
jgi:ribonuclease HI